MKSDSVEMGDVGVDTADNVGVGDHNSFGGSSGTCTGEQ